MIMDFRLHNSTTGELTCNHCGAIMSGYDTARHYCEEAREAWAKWVEQHLHDYD